uniref:CASPASE_P10 domain-containing protein n=1 Tax=Macrostomum lignano TaxID=282301 RepID=A0A1I8FGW5_9PLAT
MSDSVSQQDADQVDAGLFRRGGGRRDPAPPLGTPTASWRNPAPKLAEYQMKSPETRTLSDLQSGLSYGFLTSGAGASGAGASDAGALVAPLAGLCAGALVLAPLVAGCLWCWRSGCWRSGAGALLAPMVAGALWCWRLWCCAWRPLVLAPAGGLAPLVAAPLCWRSGAGASGAGASGAAPLGLPLVAPGAPLVLAPLVLAPLVLVRPSGAGASGAGASGAGASGAGRLWCCASGWLGWLMVLRLVLAPLVLAASGWRLLAGASGAGASQLSQQFSVKANLKLAPSAGDIRPRTGQSTRIGSDVDADNLERSFKQLGFSIMPFRDLSCEKNRLYRPQGPLETTTVWQLSCCRMARMAPSTALMARLKMEKLFRLLRPDYCPTLAGKPKLFFIQACRGSEYDKGCEVADGDNGTGRDEEDGGKLSRIPLESDFLYFYSTPPGYYSWRNDIQGSWFIQQLCHVLQRYGDSDELGHLLLMVQQAVAGNYQSNTNDDSTSGMKEIPVSVSTLRKLVYFRRK